ncbi:MAG TPA: hypothetical protein VL550_00575 [Rhodocyclaceae bacterium]|nr:hypothetical protein [Rhodocyclaceae bacterium]
MKISRIVFVSLLLSACGITPQRQPEVAHYDLPGTPPDLSAPLRSLDVSPSTWMNGNAMYYRLAYAADGSRREQYGETRWSAQPADLIETRLKRGLIGNMGSEAAKGCRLHIDLDDFVQVFDAPEASRLQLDTRAALYDASQNLLARKIFSLSRPAGSNAKSGVVASAEVTDDFAHQLQDWVRQSCH